MTEFCNGGQCSDRLKAEEKCSAHDDCEFYNCDNGSCKNPIMYYLSKKDDKDFKSSSSQNAEDYNTFWQDKDLVSDK